MKIERQTRTVITELGGVIRQVEADPSGTVRILFRTTEGAVFRQSEYLEPDDVDALIAALQEVQGKRPTTAAEPVTRLRDADGDVWTWIPNGRWSADDDDHSGHTCNEHCGSDLDWIKRNFGPLTPA